MGYMLFIIPLILAYVFLFLADKKNNKIFLILGVIIISLVSGLRGFNVGVDNHYFRLFSEDEIIELVGRRKVFDENVYE